MPGNGYYQAGSRRWAACTAPNAAECGKRLGISESAVRRLLPYTEWHHCYLKYGDKARAYYYAYDRQEIACRLRVARQGFAGSGDWKVSGADFVIGWLRARKKRVSKPREARIRAQITEAEKRVQSTHDSAPTRISPGVFPAWASLPVPMISRISRTKDMETYSKYARCYFFEEDNEVLLVSREASAESNIKERHQIFRVCASNDAFRSFLEGDEMAARCDWDGEIYIKVNVSNATGRNLVCMTIADANGWIASQEPEYKIRIRYLNHEFPGCFFGSDGLEQNMPDRWLKKMNETFALTQSKGNYDVDGNLLPAKIGIGKMVDFDGSPMSSNPLAWPELTKCGSAEVQEVGLLDSLEKNKALLLLCNRMLEACKKEGDPKSGTLFPVDALGKKMSSLNGRRLDWDLTFRADGPNSRVLSKLNRATWVIREV